MMAGGLCTADETRAVNSREHASTRDCEVLVDSRIAKGLTFVRENPWPDPAKSTGWKLKHAYLVVVADDEAPGPLNDAVQAYCDSYTYWSKSKVLPQINGEPLDLNPPRTDGLPYLTMTHGDDTATIRYPGYPDLVVPATSDKENRK
jgi:hypothetical protein